MHGPRRLDEPLRCQVIAVAEHPRVRRREWKPESDNWRCGLMRTGMNLSVCLPLTLMLLASCAATQHLDVGVSWEQFVAQHPGEPQRWSDYAPANVKVLQSADAGAAMAASKSRFAAWCSAHGGRSSPTSQPARPSTTVSTLHKSLALKFNAERAAGNEWKPIESYSCASSEFLGALVIELQPAKGSSWPAGRYAGRLTYAFFGPAQVVEFSATYERREIERTQRHEAASREREERRSAATGRLRQSPKVGDRTNVGTIIEVRPPLVLLQYDERYRALSSRPPSEWVRIETLTSSSEP